MRRGHQEGEVRDYDFEAFQRCKLAERLALLDADELAGFNRILATVPGRPAEFPAHMLTGMIALCDRTIAAKAKGARP